MRRWLDNGVRLRNVRELIGEVPDDFDDFLNSCPVCWGTDWKLVVHRNPSPRALAGYAFNCGGQKSTRARSPVVKKG